ncbi:MAG: glycosyltransferase family 4 protein, partial [Candidatus Acidiferrales bacterium]
FAPSVGGVESITMTLAEGLAGWSKAHPEDGIEVTVATQTPAAGGDDSRFPFAVVRRPGLRGLIRLIGQADAVHLAGPALLPLALGKLLRKPVFVEHHGCQAACPNGLLLFEPTQAPCPGHYMAGRYRECLRCNRASVGRMKSATLLATTPIRRWLTNRAAANITPTKWLETVLKLKFMTTIYHGIPEITTHTLPRQGIAKIAYMGRMVSSKGVPFLIEAAEQLRDEGLSFQLKMIGGGPELESMKSKAMEKLHGTIEFFGAVAPDRLEEILRDVETVVLPSLGGEVFGLVAAENMLRGKLLIVSDIGALGEVTGKTGLVFKAGDSKDLARRLRQSIEEFGLAAKMGAAARVRSLEEFTRNGMIERHVSVYKEIWNRSSGRQSVN